MLTVMRGGFEFRVMRQIVLGVQFVAGLLMRQSVTEAGEVYQAVYNRRVSHLRRMLERGADAQEAQDGAQPLVLAILMHEEEMAGLLLQHGANPCDMTLHQTENLPPGVSGLSGAELGEDFPSYTLDASAVAVVTDQLGILQRMAPHLQTMMKASSVRRINQTTQLLLLAMSRPRGLILHYLWQLLPDVHRRWLSDRILARATSEVLVDFLERNPSWALQRADIGNRPLFQESPIDFDENDDLLAHQEAENDAQWSTGRGILSTALHRISDSPAPELNVVCLVLQHGAALEPPAVYCRLSPEIGPAIRHKLLLALWRLQRKDDFDTYYAAFPHVAVETDESGYSLLHRAVQLLDPDLCRRLLAAGSPPNARNFLGRTPLHLAAILKSEPILELLVRGGADPQLRDLCHGTAGKYHPQLDGSVRARLNMESENKETSRETLQEEEKRAQSARGRALLQLGIRTFECGICLEELTNKTELSMSGVCQCAVAYHTECLTHYRNYCKDAEQKLTCTLCGHELGSRRDPRGTIRELTLEFHEPEMLESAPRSANHAGQPD